MESIRPVSWGPPVAYLYTLKLDYLALAWEYLRRNMQYRSEFVCATHNQKRTILSSAWGLASWEDPQEDARCAEPAWLGAVHSRVTLVQGRDGDARSFDLWKISGRKTLHHQGEYLNLISRRGSEISHRVRWTNSLSQGDPFDVSIPVDRGFQARAQVAHRFLRSLDSDSEGSVPPRAERPSINAVTHMQVLQAFDGNVAGASHREIAQRLFGLSREFSWDADSRWRARIRYLIKCGLARCDGGYRRLAGFDAPESPSTGVNQSPDQCVYVRAATLQRRMRIPPRSSILAVAATETAA